MLQTSRLCGRETNEGQSALLLVSVWNRCARYLPVRSLVSVDENNEHDERRDDDQQQGTHECTNVWVVLPHTDASQHESGLGTDTAHTVKDGKNLVGVVTTARKSAFTANHCGQTIAKGASASADSCHKVAHASWRETTLDESPFVSPGIRPIAKPDSKGQPDEEYNGQSLVDHFYKSSCGLGLDFSRNCGALSRDRRRHTGTRVGQKTRRRDGGDGDGKENGQAVKRARGIWEADSICSSDRSAI